MITLTKSIEFKLNIVFYNKSKRSSRSKEKNTLSNNGEFFKWSFNLQATTWKFLSL